MTTSGPERATSGIARARHSVVLPVQRRERLAAFVQRHPRLIPPLEVTHLDWRVADLPPALDGFTIAQISDLHVGEGAWRAMRLDEAIATLRAAEPDVVINTGDFLQHEPPIAKVMFQFWPLVRASEGVPQFAILGNHDYYADEQHVVGLKAHLRELGVEVLINQVRVHHIRDQRVTFAGLTLEEPGIESAIAELKMARGLRVVLVHEPEVAEHLPAGAADLVFAGHTHGGQITLPFLERLIVKRFCGSGYVEGLNRISGNSVYINRGLGCTGLPIRFRAQPEVTVVRLRR